MTATIDLSRINQPGDLVLPTARVLHVVERGTTLNDIANLPYRLGGRARKPRRPLAWRDRDGNTTLIAGLGIAEAAEIQELAYALHERQQVSDWETQDARRARAGLPSVAQTRERIQTAMAAKAAWFSRHAVTGRAATYDPTEKRLY